MRIGTKLTLSYVIVLLLMSALAVYAVNTSIDSLKERVGKDTVLLAQDMMQAIRERIRTDEDHLRAYSQRATPRAALRESNSRFETFADPEELIMERNKEWISTPEGETSPLIREVIESECSADAANMFIHFFEVSYGYRIYEEVIISNRYGTGVCQSQRTLDYYHADKEWWQHAKKDGFHVGEVEYDKKSKTYGLPVAARIEDADGTFLGVARGVISLLAVVREAELVEKRYESTEVQLITGNGRLLYATRAFKFFEDMSGREHFTRATGENGYFIEATDSKKRMYSYVRSRNVADPAESEWILLLGHDLDEVLRPIVLLRNRMLFGSVILVGIAVLISAFTGRSIGRPLTRLTKAAEEVARGNLGAKVEIASRDEIGILAGTFNLMTENLVESYSRLDEEMQERKSAQAELEALNERLLRSNEELARSNKELEDFAYIASHDLREPLRGIRNFSAFLLEDYTDKLDVDGQSKLQTLVRLSKRMEDFVEALLTYSRVGRRELSLGETDLNDLLDQVIESLEVPIKESGASVRIDRPLPVVRCERIRVGQVFSNLITNALKYNDKAEKWIEVGCIRNKEETGPADLLQTQRAAGTEMLNTGIDGCIFYVRDNGIGIREKHFDAIFRIFKRLHGRDEYGGGAGAGLTITRKIVEWHGGRIWMESRYGEGTTFFFTLQGDEHESGGKPTDSHR